MLLLALLFAIFTTLLGYHIFKMSTTHTDPVDYIDIPIASRDIEPMTKIEQGSMTFVKIPKGVSKQFSFIVDPNEILNKMALSKIEKNAPFVRSYFYDEKKDIPFELPDGYRAITIESDSVIGVGGYLKHGMFVDIVWTQVVENNPTNTIVMFENIKVLAVGPPKDKLTSPSNEKETITLMMKGEDVPKLTHASQTGKLRLVLRPSPTDEKGEVESFAINNVVP